METIAIQRYTRDHGKHILIIGLIFLWFITSFFHLFSSGFFSNSVAFAGTLGNGISNNSLSNVGVETNAFLDDLRDINVNPEIVANSSRAFFSVEGKMITFLDSNIKIYEYTDSKVLMMDLENFKKSAKTRYGSWKNNVHLYVNESLIVFYMGESGEINNALKSVLGNEVVM